jgi:two-component system OmpR family sensor kinase
MSLRARLIALLVALATLGLVVLAAVTYAEQRSFLLQRVQDHGMAALADVSHRLDPGSDGDRGHAPGGGADPGQGDGAVGAGVFGQLRDASGHVVRSSVLVGYGQAAPPRPELPANVSQSSWTTVGSVGGSGLRYIVRAFPRPDGGGTTVVAMPLAGVDQTLHRLLAVEGLVIAAVMVVLGGIAWWIVRLGLRPLDRMAATADAIAAGDLSRRVAPATTRTEVGRLGLALNGMLAQIERAFAERQASENRLRRFLADASHELRTPLVSIRGYAELFRMGAASEPAEAERAMARIEGESKRMGVLVEDLLTLARLDQLPERSRHPVELGRVAADTADDARAASPDRPIELVANEAAIVDGDASQLRQVLGNLVRNALVHTPTGTPIELRVSRTGDEVVLEVRDHGPGLPTADPGELFERFWRSDPARGRGPAGAGLGLSIVAALVAAHGGSVNAENAPGGGALFTVRLPAAVPDASQAQHSPIAPVPATIGV